MRILIIDGMGGGIGKAVIERLAAEAAGHELIAVGTNALAAAAMRKAGASRAASGENAVAYNCAKADVIIGTIGIMAANAMCGEVSPAMAAAVSGAEAVKILLPNQRCGVYVLGVGNVTAAQCVDEIPAIIKRLEAEHGQGR